MKLRKFGCLCFALLGFACECLAYTNPVIESNRCDRDPDCMTLGGFYYLVSPYKNGYKMFTSVDLVKWDYQGVVFSRSEGKDVWQGYIHQSAPDEFFLYYTSIENGEKGVEKYINLAKASSPFGPWKDCGRLIQSRNGIDPFLYEDSNGQLYLYYKWPADGEKSIYVQKMSDPVTPEGDDKEILKPIAGTWEEGGDYLSLEGPSVIKIANQYCLFVAGGGWADKRYAVGYALADHPMGPFVRAPHNPIISWEENPQIFAPGVANPIEDARGNYWLVYRQKVNDIRMDGARFVAVDRLEILSWEPLYLESFGTRDVEVGQDPADSLVAIGQFTLENTGGHVIRAGKKGEAPAVFQVSKSAEGYRLRIPGDLATDESIDFDGVSYSFNLCHYNAGKHFFRIQDTVSGRYLGFDSEKAMLRSVDEESMSELFSVNPIH